MAYPPEVTKAITEFWTLYSIASLFIFARIWTRTKLIGFRNYDLDDYVILFTFAAWTTVATIAHVFVVKCQGRHTSELTHEQREAMPVDEYHEWEYGSQIFLFGLSTYFLIVWSLKFNMCCLYRRVVRGLATEKLVLPVMGLVVASFVAIVLTISLTCRPFWHLWQVWPDPGPNCVPQNKVFFITILTLNLLTDTCIIAIPLPVIWGVRTTLWKRLGLYLCFTLGAFCMMAAILRYVLIFKLNQAGISAYWSLREDFVGIIVGQLPLVVPMLRKSFWVRTGYMSHDEPDTGNSSELVTIGQKSSRGTRERKRKVKDPYNLTTVAMTVNESEEKIVPSPAGDSALSPSQLPAKTGGGGRGGGRDSGGGDNIRVESRIEVESSKGDESDAKRVKDMYYAVA